MRKLILGATVLAVGGFMAVPAFADPPGCPPVVSGSTSMLFVDAAHLCKNIAVGLMYEGAGEIIIAQAPIDPWQGLFKQMLGDPGSSHKTKLDGGSAIVTAMKPEGPGDDRPQPGRLTAEMDWPYRDRVLNHVGATGMEHGAFIPLDRIKKEERKV